MRSGDDLDRVWRDILSQAKGLAPAGDGHTARCPAHDDNRNSLSIGRGTDGRVLLHCHVGCDTAKVSLAFGYSLTDLGVPRDAGPKKARSPEADWPIVASYEYFDPDGILAYEVCRCEPKEQPATGKRQKTFRQRRPDGKGGWTWKVKGIAQYPYRLPELLAAKPGVPVFVCEGEKNCERLRSIGCVATTNPGGAGKWRKKYTAYLKGRHVVVIPDFDPPNKDTGKRVGTEHALTVAGELYGEAASVRVLLLPGLLEGQDVFDWLEGGHTAADLKAAVEACPEWVPEQPLGALANAPAPSRDERLKNAEADDSAEKITKALRLDVLGETEDGRIKVFSEYLRKTVMLRDTNRLTHADMLQHFGEPVKAFVYKGLDEAPPDMFKVGDVRGAIALLAGRRRIGDETEIGPGCWCGMTEDGRPQLDTILMVSSGEAAVLNGRPEPQKLSVPRYGGRLLELSGSRPWFDFDELTAEVAAATPERAEAMAAELEGLFERWHWRHKHSAAVATGLVLASWIQTLWPWRPQVALIGPTKAGKSLLMSTLEGLYGSLAIRSSDSTAAGLRQEVARSARVVLLDEFDANKNRQSILEMLRIAGRGDLSLRGTPGHKSQSFRLQHLVWLAGINSGLKREPDRNRFIVLELQQQSAAKLGAMIDAPVEAPRLRLASLAVAVRSFRRASDLLPVLRDARPKGFDDRVAASYAVPAAMYAAAFGLGNEKAVEVFRHMIDATGGEDEAAGATDENELLRAILQSDVDCGRGERKTVSQIINPTKYFKKDRDPDDEFELPDLPHLERVGLTVFHDREGDRGDWMFVDHKAVTRKLLGRTDWETATIEEVLRRIQGAVKRRWRMAGQRPYGIAIPLTYIRDL